MEAACADGRASLRAWGSRPRSQLPTVVRATPARLGGLPLAHALLQRQEGEFDRVPVVHADSFPNPSWSKFLSAPPYCHFLAVDKKPQINKVILSTDRELAC